jgi:hypothetical protein
MEWIFLFLAFVGAATTACGLAVVVILTIGLSSELIEPENKKSFIEGGEAERSRLLSNSWWFSEHVPTMNLLADLAKGCDVSEARDRWREAMESEADQ